MNEGAGTAAGAAHREGDRNPLLNRIPELFHQHHVDVEIRAVPGIHIAAAARELIENGAQVIVAAGGDGTLSTVASMACRFERPLGVLPLGTLNHFAKDLNIPLELPDAVDQLVHGEPQPVDVAEVNRRTFINNASLGAYAGIVETRESQAGLLRNKHLATTIATIKTLIRRPLVHVRLEFDGKQIHRTTPFVFVGNNIYSVRLRNVGSRPRLDEGLLCVYAARCTGVLCFLRLIWRTLCNRLEESVEFDTWSTTELLVHPHRRRVRLAIDGEVNRLDGPLVFRSRPGALRVIAPPRPLPDDPPRQVYRQTEQSLPGE